MHGVFRVLNGRKNSPTIIEAGVAFIAGVFPVVEYHHAIGNFAGINS